MEPSEYKDEQLVNTAGTGAAVAWVPIEMMRRLKNSIAGLNNSITTFNETTTEKQNVMIELAQESGKQTRVMIRLTWVIAILTFILAIDFVMKLLK